MILAHLPNLLTAARLLMVPVTVWMLFEDRMTAAFWLFVAAGATDAIDGTLARLLNARSIVGAYLDPLADKALLVSIYVALGITDHMQPWLVATVVFRDALILAGAVAFYLMVGRTEVRPLFISKVTTVLQIVFAALVLGRLGLGLDLGLVELVSGYAVAAATVTSGLVYLVLWSRRFGAVPAEPGDGP